MERQERWEPVEGIVTPAARAVIEEDENGLAVTLMFSEIVNGLDSDLRIRLGRVPAYTVYEEFVHPWNISQTELPKLAGEWESYAFPLLLIHDSAWLDSLTGQLISYPDSVHYRFVTLDQVVDVLCTNPPEVTWINKTLS
jgi:hypothetical protein